MNELKPIVDTADKKYGLQFAWQGTEYVIWQWLQADNESYQLNLSKIVQDGNKWTNGGVLVAMGSSPVYIDTQGGISGVFDTFLERVNAYLADQISEDDMEDAGFPEDGTAVEKFNWLINFGVAFGNGVLTRK